MQLLQTLTYIILVTQSILVTAKTLRGTDNSFIIHDENDHHQRQLYQEQELPWVKYINPAKRDPHRELLAGRAYRMFTAGANTDDIKSQSIVHHVNSAIEEATAIETEEDNLFEQEVNQLKKDPRIIGGSNAGSSEFPWAVSMQDRIGHFCGGSLIASNIVLTAA